MERSCDGVSPLATLVGRTVLRAGNYPGRRVIGTLIRRKARLEGGRSFQATSADGTRIAGWYMPAMREGRPARTGGASLPIVLSHGWCEVKEFHFPRARRLCALGHDVVLFDHRGHGRSGGRNVTFGVREREDVKAVADYAAERGWIGERFVTMGFSLGAATVLQHAATDERVAGVVAIAPFVDFRGAIRSFKAFWAPWMREGWLLAGFERAARAHGFEIGEADTLEAMGRIRSPVLLVEGGKDRNLPPAEHTQKLIAAQCGCEVKVVRVEGASHRTAGHAVWPEVEREVARFCQSLA